MTERRYFVYIMMRYDNEDFYIGTTEDMASIMLASQFFYDELFDELFVYWRLVYYDFDHTETSASHKADQLKHFSQKRIYNLIERHNPGKLDLAAGIF